MTDYKESPYRQRSPSLIRRLWRGFWNFVDQLMMIFDLQTLDDSVSTRLRRLRFIYYHDDKVDISYRRVRDVLRGHVAKEHYAYYERLMNSERAMFQALQSVPPHLDGEAWLEDMQRLGGKIVHLIEQLEEAKGLLAQYTPESAAAQKAAELADWLTQEIESALDLQQAVPLEFIQQKRDISENVIRRSRERLSQKLENLEEAVYDAKHLAASDGELNP